MAKALMIDAETLAVGTHRPIIISVAVLEFDPNLSDTIRTLEDRARVVYPSIEEQVFFGRETLRSTLDFWAEQRPDICAKGGFTQTPPEKRQSILDVLSLIYSVGRGIWGDCAIDGRASTYWSNGAADDLIWIETLAGDFGDAGCLIPWRYNEKRCYRTLRDFPHGLQLREPYKDRAHDPRHNVAVQAANVQIIHNRLKGV